MSTFLARYNGSCADPTCEHPIDPGDIVEYIDEQLVHQGCRPPVEDAPRPVCPNCFMTKALNGACGCEVYA